MLFNSSEFLVLLGITFALYYTRALRSFQMAILLVSSLVFYGFHQPWLLTLLLFSIFVNAVASYRVYYGEPSRRLSWATLGVCVNLGLLIFFKYSGLLYRTFAQGASGPVSQFLNSIPLPIGISFFTFQGISLVVDTYRMKKSGRELFTIHRSFASHLFTIAFFKSFFPQLVSGPIVKAHEFLPQIKLKSMCDIHWGLVFRQVVVGYFLKMVVADQLQDQTFWITPSFFQNCSSLTLVTLLFGYSMQIFADFAGYSLIALGTAGLFSYRLPDNFNYPYISRSFSEFWTRWHISLSTFLKQYLYFPLGGNRHGELRTYFNLAMVMVLGGLWHGATWSYAVWGCWHGLLLVLERAFGANDSSKDESRILTFLRMVFVFSMVTVGWLLFKLPNFSDAISFVKSVFMNFSVPHQKMLIFNVMIFSIPVIGYHAWYLLKSATSVKVPSWCEAAVYGALLFFILTSTGEPGAFIYFQF
jgi:alginate O-acetyltransferase complex protein AlgI